MVHVTAAANPHRPQAHAGLNWFPSCLALGCHATLVPLTTKVLTPDRAPARPARPAQLTGVAIGFLQLANPVTEAFTNTLQLWLVRGWPPLGSGSSGS
jgi:hypothetical protein